MCDRLEIHRSTWRIYRPLAMKAPTRLSRYEYRANLRTSLESNRLRRQIPLQDDTEMSRTSSSLETEQSCTSPAMPLTSWWRFRVTQHEHLKSRFLEPKSHVKSQTDRYVLRTRTELPQWMEANPYILSGYRCQRLLGVGFLGELHLSA